MPVTRIFPEDSDQAKKRKLKEIKEAGAGLKATREAIEKVIGEPKHPN